MMRHTLLAGALISTLLVTFRVRAFNADGTLPLQAAKIAKNGKSKTNLRIKSLPVVRSSLCLLIVVCNAILFRVPNPVMGENSICHRDVQFIHSIGECGAHQLKFVLRAGMIASIRALYRVISERKIIHRVGEWTDMIEAIAKGNPSARS